MREDTSISPRTRIFAIFWEGLGAGKAITSLFSVGFDERDVCAVGVLIGQPPNLSGLLATMGVPAEETSYYNECFQEGAILVGVRTQTSSDERKFLEIVLRNGGVLAPSRELVTTAAN